MFEITDVAVPDFIPVCCNPFEEPISVGQYVLWDMFGAVPTHEESDIPHSNVQKIATDSYLKAANKQQAKFDGKLISTTF